MALGAGKRRSKGKLAMATVPVTVTALRVGAILVGETWCAGPAHRYGRDCEPR